MLPVVSNLTGALADADEIRTADYWVRHVREAVRFADGVAALRAAGVDTFLEVGPQSVLTAMARGRPARRRRRAGRRRPAPGPAGGAGAAGTPWPSCTCTACRSTWQQWFADTGARPGGPAHVRLPAPAVLARRRPGASADVSGAGLGVAGHPLLGAAVRPRRRRRGGADRPAVRWPRTRGWPTTSVSGAVAGARAPPWWSWPCGPATRWARRGVRELTVAAPLVLPDAGGGAGAGAASARPTTSGVRVGGRATPSPRTTPRRAGPGTPRACWSRRRPTSRASGAWPPAGASEVDLAGWYPALAEHGLAYGPVFQGLRRAWTAGGEVYAEVALPDEAARRRGAVRGAPGAAGRRPAPDRAAAGASGSGGPRVPFAFEGVQVHASGARMLRVRLTRDGSGVRLVACDESGAPVVSVDSLALRELTGVAAPGAAARSLFEVAWQAEEIDRGRRRLRVGAAGRGRPTAGALPDGAGRPPDVGGAGAAVAGGPAPPGGAAAAGARPADAGGATPDAVRAVTSDVLATVRSWLAADALADSRLVVVTRGAVSVGDDDRVTDLAGAAVWGLLRSAQSEHPGRIVLADVDGDVDAGAAGRAGRGCDEPAASGGQVAVRGGRVFVPRLVRAVAPASVETPGWVTARCW